MQVCKAYKDCNHNSYAYIGLGIFPSFNPYKQVVSKDICDDRFLSIKRQDKKSVNNVNKTCTASTIIILM